MLDHLKVFIDEVADHENTVSITTHDYKSKADSFINSSRSKNTKRAYIGDIKYFFAWLSISHPEVMWPITEDIVLKFIFHHAAGEMPIEIEEQLIAKGIKSKRGPHDIDTVRRRLVALSVLHKINNQPNPCDTHQVKNLLTAMHKQYNSQKKAKPIMKVTLENILAACNGDSLKDIRDKALILFGWASGGRRRSEISEAIYENLTETPEGNYIYKMQRSKTDQKGIGRDVPIKGAAAMSLRAWLQASQIRTGRLFRSIAKGGKKIGEKLTDVDVNRIIKNRCQKAGYAIDQYSAHSLRSGFMTEGGKQRKPLGDLMAMSGHSNFQIAQGYYQAGDVINNTAADLLS